jgi:DNA-binding beta-propeller fold protein YncE
MRHWLVRCGFAAWGIAAAGPKPVAAIDLPNGKPGIGFDDLQYSRRLGRVLAPAGRAGTLALVDPATRKVTVIGAFSQAKTYDGGHDFGVTSVADIGDGLAVTDRTSDELVVIDDAGKVRARAKLAGGPDYVRWLPARKELWVTEPDAQQIEVFAGSPLRAVDKIAVPGGPESLAIDDAHGRAYTHKWKGETVAIDVSSRTVGKPWANGCTGSRGVEIDAARELVLVGCADGTATVLSERDGKLLSKLQAVNGQDIIAYSTTKHHLYLAGSESADSAILAVSEHGELKLLGKGPGAPGGHCITTDDGGRAYVCDPRGGRLVVVDDPY